MTRDTNENHTYVQEHHIKYTDSYVNLLDAYKTQIEKSSEKKNELKQKFFDKICFIMYAMIFLFIGTLLITFAISVYMVYTKSISLSIISGAITAIVSSFVTVLTAILKLPQIIANYLFNKDEGNQMVEIIKSIQQYELGIAKTEHTAEEKAEDEKKIISDENLLGKIAVSDNPTTLKEENKQENI